MELSFGPGILTPCGSCHPKFVDFTIQSDDSIVEIGISPARAWMFPPEMLDVTQIKIWQPQFGLKKHGGTKSEMPEADDLIKDFTINDERISKVSRPNKDCVLTGSISFHGILHPLRYCKWLESCFFVNVFDLPVTSSQ